MLNWDKKQWKLFWLGSTGFFIITGIMGMLSQVWYTIVISVIMASISVISYKKN